MNNFRIVLASGSAYRRELLARLGLPFSTWSPDIDEGPRRGELPKDTASRLAREKATAAAAHHAQAWIIGSDQVADLDGAPVGKPGSRERAVEQLRAMRGRAVVFHTAVCLLAPGGQPSGDRLVDTEVAFRRYSDAEIERYLDREPAFDCAGSAKSEGLGISLIEKLAGEDPTALVGLPLVALSALLREAGFEVP